MPPHRTPRHRNDQHPTDDHPVHTQHQSTLRPPRRRDGDVVYAVVGLLVLLTMLLVATETIPLYEWRT